MPKVSIILTSYNHEEFIAKAIESVLTQTFTDYELLINDDGSTDQSQEIIKSYEDERIILHLREKNKCGQILRELLPLCRGEYIAIHHSDDIWESEKLQKQVDFLDKHPDVVACFTHVQIIDEHGKDYIPPEGSLYHNVFDQPNRNRYEWLRFFLFNYNALCHPSVLIRKETYKDFNLFSSGLIKTGDFLMWIRVCLHAEIHIIQEKLTKFRIHTLTQANTSGDKPETHICAALELFFIYDDLFKITDLDLFFKVFPEYNGHNVIPEYVFARKLIEVNYPASQLYGLKKIYEILNNPKKAQRLKKMHNYSYVDYAKETKNYDVFSIFRHSYNGKIDMMTVDKAVRASKNGLLFLFGAGEIASYYTIALKERNVKISGYIVSDGHNQSNIFMGCQVINLSSFTDKHKDSHVLVAVGVSLRDSLYIKLKNAGITNIIL